MAEFKKIPALLIGDKYKWELYNELVYQSDLWPEPIIVPAGFETDLASILRVFLPLIPRNGHHRAGAIVHDYLVRQDDFNRHLADKIFLEAMKVLGVKRLRRRLMYWAVVAVTVFKYRGK